MTKKEGNEKYSSVTTLLSESCEGYESALAPSSTRNILFGFNIYYNHYVEAWTW